MEEERRQEKEGFLMTRISKKYIEIGQVTLEYMVCMIAAVLLLVGMIQAASWTGRELVDRRQTHEAVLVTPIGHDQAKPLEQIRPLFFKGTEFGGSSVASNVFGNFLY